MRVYVLCTCRVTVFKQGVKHQLKKSCVVVGSQAVMVVVGSDVGIARTWCP